jgi:cytochrome c oxidase subunit 2
MSLCSLPIICMISSSHRRHLAFVRASAVVVAALALGCHLPSDAKPIVRKSSAAPPATAVQILVYRHKGWWEFKYPQYMIVTANEIYLPAGHPVLLTLESPQGVNAFLIPQLAANRTFTISPPQQLWFTVATTHPATVEVGGYDTSRGPSHINGHFFAFAVAPPDFARWASAQQAPAVSLLQSSRPAPAGYIFPRSQIPSSVLPETPSPPRLTYNPKLAGEPGRGELLFAGTGTCIACHTVRGMPLPPTLGSPGTCMACHTSLANSMGRGGPAPDLTHLASRATIAGGLYPNDRATLSRWLKNARLMKPGIDMPTLGKGEYDPQLKRTNTTGLDDQQIADLVAYLIRLK